MSIGNRNRRVTVQQPSTERDPLGQSIDDPVAVCTVWASVEHLRGRQFYAAQQSQSEVTTEIGVRYLKGITTNIRPHMRVVAGDDTYEIVAVIPKRPREILLLCKAVG